MESDCAALCPSLLKEMAAVGNSARDFGSGGCLRLCVNSIAESTGSPSHKFVELFVTTEVRLNFESQY